MWGEHTVWNPRQIVMADFLALGRMREEDWTQMELTRLNEYVREVMVKGDYNVSVAIIYLQRVTRYRGIA